MPAAATSTSAHGPACGRERDRRRVRADGQGQSDLRVRGLGQQLERARRRSRPRSPCPATLTHSRTEWNSFPPVKMFGVGRPISVSREPSVPPRIDVEPRLEAGAAGRLERRLDHVRDPVERLAHVAVLIPALEGHARAGVAGDGLLGEPAHERSCSLELRRRRGRAGSASPWPHPAPPSISSGCTKPSRPSVVSGESESGGRLVDEPGRELDRVDELPLRRCPDGRRRRGR